MRLTRMLKKMNWKVYFMELIIVILGISIAYQVNIYNESRVNQQLEMTAIKNLKKENEINLAEFKSLEAYRERITTDSRQLLRLLTAKEPISKDTAARYVFRLVQTSTPDLQQEATGFYLNSNYGNQNIELKNNLLTLKTYLQELLDLSKGYQDRKMNDFMTFLRTAVDFPSREVVNISTIRSLEFKNIIWNLYSDEIELNRLYKQAKGQLEKVQEQVEAILEKEA